MRSRFLWSIALVLVPFYPAAAQRSANDTVRADSLRHRIEERFSSRVQQELGLTNDQTAKLRASSEQFGSRRRQMHVRERQLHEALRAQLQPGVAANQDSVAKLTNAMVDLRLAAAQSTRDEMKDLSKYLSPVQRARFFLMRERLRDRVKEAREHRGMRGGGEGWGRGKGHDGEMGAEGGMSGRQPSPPPSQPSQQ
jgi:Spy/CpxP family protein refolding chaperone